VLKRGASSLAVVACVLAFGPSAAEAAWCSCACSNGQKVNVCSYGEVKNPSCFGPCYRPESPVEEGVREDVRSLLGIIDHRPITPAIYQTPVPQGAPSRIMAQ